MQSVNLQSSRCGEMLGGRKSVLALHVDQLVYQDYRLDMADLVTRVEACLTSNETSAECVRGSLGPWGRGAFLAWL